MTSDADDPDDFDDDLDLGALDQVNPITTTVTNVANAPTVPPQAPPPPKLHHYLDKTQISSYIYPTNLPIRDYQYSIVNRALYHNVLVALPTGLGKTFIASTVMLNFLRWFPRLKIIFMAPTKPLVAQQIKACCGITGIPSSRVAILLDRTRRNRAEIWDEKSVFFTTPQVVENDLTAGIVDPKLISLLVIDEAHRAKGNYAYNNVVKFVSRFSQSFRILALTATPASDVEGVQEIINNLHISFVEVRTEKSIDIFKYLKRKKVERITADLSEDVTWAIDQLALAAAPILTLANEKGIYDITDTRKINAFAALDAQQRLVRNQSIPEGLKWANFFILQLLIVIGQCLRRLNIYGIRAFYQYFLEKHKEFTTKFNDGKLKNKLAAKFYFHPSIKELVTRCETLVSDPKYLGHRKLDITLDELNNFFKYGSNMDSRVIIFTEFRQSALDIVRAIENSAHLGEVGDTSLRPHIFIGQAKEKEKFDELSYSKKGKKNKSATSQEKKQSPKTFQTSSESAQLSGMNQKMQKELIKQFKNGTYNVLVATSIGEEGLDIGEVDLIICYDLTSSPIKNIQRMGRTGRNRDGKVILLFSSNEEAKFDKAMAGYDFIQQHIMTKLVELKPQNRMIPNTYTPNVEEKEIEIPRENMEIKQEDDEDEIIRLATKYMTLSQSATLRKASKNAGGKKAKKIEKRFFMPDDVETGFRLAGLMVRDDPEAVKKRRIEEHGYDILDLLLDSEVDEEVSSGKIGSKMTQDKLEHPVEQNQNIEDCSKKNAIPVKLESIDSVKVPSGSDKSHSGRRVLKQPEIFNWRTNTGVLKTEESEGITGLAAPSTQENQQKPSIPQKTHVGSQLEHPTGDSPCAPFSPEQSIKNSNIQEENLLDNDDLESDEDILALANRTQHHWRKEESVPPTIPPYSTETPTNAVKLAKSEDPTNLTKRNIKNSLEEKIFRLNPGDGLLSKAQKLELYLQYYSPPDHKDKITFQPPLHVPQDGYEVQHSKTSQNYISFCLKLTSLTDAKAEDLLDLYDTVAALNLIISEKTP